MKIEEIQIAKSMDLIEIQTLLDSMEAQYKIQGSLNVLALVEYSSSYDSFTTYLRTLRMKSYFYGLIRRFAIVTSNSWVYGFGRFADFLTPGLTIRVFLDTEIEEAKQWLLEGEVKFKANISLQYTSDNSRMSFHVNDRLDSTDLRFIDSVIIEEYTYNRGVVNLHLDFSGIESQDVVLMVPDIENLKHWQKVTSVTYRIDGEEYLDQNVIT